MAVRGVVIRNVCSTVLTFLGLYVIFSILFAPTSQTKSVLVMSLVKKKAWNKKT